MSFAARTLLRPALCLLLAACSRGGDAGDDPTAQADLAGEAGGPAGSGRCESDPIVHPEAAPEPGAGPSDLAFSAVDGFTVPAALGQAEAREVFTSAAAFERYFGAPAPGVDFSKRWVFFYSAGQRATDGFVPSVSRVRTVDDQVRIDTGLEAPGAGCAVKMEPSRPALLVAFDRPALPLCRATYHHVAATRACVPAEPGPACGGTLTDRGIDELVTTRPRASIPSETTYTPYSSKSVSLGGYATARFSRVCKSEAECDPWAPVTLSGDYYNGQAYFYREGATQRLILISRVIPYQVNIGGGMFKSCYRFAAGMGDLVKQMDGSTQGTLRLTEDSGCYSGGATANGDSFRLGPVSGAFADRCFRLTERKRETLGVASFRETLTTVTGSW